MTSLRPKYPIRTLGAAMLLAPMAAAPAQSQLATSPGAVEASGATLPEAPTAVPAVGVVAPSTAAAPSARRRVELEPASAPRAAEQTTTPRTVDRARPASLPGTVAAPDNVPAAANAPVTTTVAPTGIAQPVATAGGAVTVVGGAEIEARQVRNAPELLSAVPGLQVVQTGGPGGTTSVFTRGTNSNHTKVFIDGIDVSNPVDANRTFDFGLLTTFDTDRVEVLRGPQSGLYGADALGGVIVLYTPDGDGPPKVQGLVEGGSFGTLNEAASLRGSTGGFRYSFNASHSKVDGFPVVPERLLAPGAPLLDSVYENWTFATKLGADVSPFLSFNVAARYTDSEFRFQSGLADAGLTTSRSDQLYTRGETILALHGGRLKTILGINYTEVDAETRSDVGDLTASGVGTRVKADWRTIAEVMPGLTVTTGADWQNERLTQPATVFAPGLAVEEANTGAYVQAQLQPVRNLFLVGNFRYDDNESFGEATTWRFAPTAVIEATGTTFRASFGTAFKAPSLSQRFQDFPDPLFPFLANRNLRPEKSRGMDAGFEQALLSGRARTGLTYFRNEIEDLIDFVFDPSILPFGGGTVANIGQAETSGVEIFFAADVTDTLRLRADYTYTEAINVATREDLLRRPREKASLAIGWQALPPLVITTTILHIGERFDIDRVTFERIRQSSFTTVNVAADYKLNDRVSLIGRVDNLLDRDYEDPNGFQRPGLGAYAGVRVRN